MGRTQGLQAMAASGGTMRKKVLVRGPCLSQSGYGEHARMVLRSLRSREDLFDIYIIPTSWGHTGWTLRF